MSKILNFKLLGIIIMFMLLSIITINSSMTYLPSDLGNLVLKQITWYIVGFCTMFLIIYYPFKTKNFTYFFYYFNILLLILLLFKGTPINGSKCWIIIPKIGSFQPSEFMKIAIILMTSNIIGNHKIRKNYKTHDEIILLLKVLLIFLIPAVLTYLEPDTGSILIYLIIIFSILLVSPLRKRWFIFILFLIIMLLLSFLIIYIFKKEMITSILGSSLYRIERFIDWKNGNGMQLENSLAAIGASGLLGFGYMNTPIYFPESGTDFIFSVYANNFGLIGCIFLIFIFILFINTLFNLCIKEDNLTNKYIIVGCIGMLVYQTIQNIGMTIGILPITGITLPFISYGGSSLVSYFIIIGIVLRKKEVNLS